MMHWKGFGRKRLWPDFKALSQRLPEGTEENQENLRVAGLRAVICTGDLLNTKQEC
jgi:hypothetical protein